MLKFTALPVSEGDAFLLLCSDDKIILVDTGLDKSECLKFLQDKGIKKLDLVVITHYDKDHIGGLQEILKSIEISEIWLPDVFGKIHKSAKKPGVTLLKKCIEYEQKREEQEDSNEKDLYQIVTMYKLLQDLNLKIEETNENKFITFIPRDDNSLFGYINSGHIKRIMNIVEFIDTSTTNIIWLNYVEGYLPFEINLTIPLFGLNCVQTKNLRPYINDLELILYLTQINRESLVFKYCKEEEPNILFSSDSNYDFLSDGEEISLNNNSIVTAPHHGSKSNNRTYKLVKGENLIYVRSYSKKVALSTCYFKLKKKYCVKCNHKNGREGEVKLEYTKSRGWNPTCNDCICTESAIAL